MEQSKLGIYTMSYILSLRYYVSRELYLLCIWSCVGLAGGTLTSGAQVVGLNSDRAPMDF